MDMGKEWFNILWEVFWKSQGLIFEFTTPYVYQQNGVAEWAMQMVLDSTRTMLAKLGISLKYWANAIQSVIYVKNFIPSLRQSNIVPAKVWFRQCQSVSHLRPFGTIRYVYVPFDLNISKLSP